MRCTISTILLLLTTYCLQAQIAGEGSRPQGEEPTMKMPDDEAIRIIKQQALETQFGLHYVQSISQGNLRRVFEFTDAPAVGYGFGAEGGLYFDPMPLAIGWEVGLLFNGAESKTLRANDFYNTRFIVSSSNVQIPILMHVRFEPNIESWVFPYAEALGGFTVYSSSVSIERIRGVDTARSSDGNGSITWNYGIGAGVAIKIADVITLPNSLQRTLFDVRIRYMWGTDAAIPNAKLDDGNDLGYTLDEVLVVVPQVVMFRAGFIFQM